jgi:hypothetical protein
LVTHKNSNLKEIVRSINEINEWFLFLGKFGNKKKSIKI